MAAKENLRQLPQSHNSVPRHGVLTLVGYGIQVRVDKGHLIIQDGIGAARYHYRLPRVGHGLKRLVVVGSDGQISLAALSWLRDQDVAFSFLERNGKVLCVTGPVGSSDAKLRRAQAFAINNGVGLEICRATPSTQNFKVRNKACGSASIMSRRQTRSPAFATGWIQQKALTPSEFSNRMRRHRIFASGGIFL